MMGCTVAEAQDRVDAREFAGWIAWRRLHPSVRELIDSGQAQLCALVASAASGKRKKPKDYLLMKPGGENVATNPDDAIAVLSALFPGAKVTGPGGELVDEDA